jgi:uncharacterized protein
MFYDMLMIERTGFKSNAYRKAVSCLIAIMFVFGFAIAAYALRGSVLAADEQDIAFAGAGGLELPGTMTRPKTQGSGKAPAILLLPGSGPTDRNGNQLPGFKTDLLSQLSNSLAQGGFVTLRYDKRGVNFTPKDADKRFGGGEDALADFLQWRHQVDDAAAAVLFLAAQPGVDAASITVLGHSEGGLVAIELSRKLELPIANLVLMATPGRPLSAVLKEQLAHVLTEQGASETERIYFFSEMDRIDRTIAETGKIPADVPEGLKALYPRGTGKFLQQQNALHPAEVLGRAAMPAFVIQGEYDAQVSAKLDVPLLAEAIKGKRDGSAALIVPGISHNFKPVTSPSDQGFAGNVPDAVLNSIESWLKKISG